MKLRYWVEVSPKLPLVYRAMPTTAQQIAYAFSKLKGDYLMKKRLLYLILPIITLILEILPYGAVCNFAHPETDGTIGRFRELYSYFDLLPFGYANFAPLLTAIVTCFVFLFLVIYCFTDCFSSLTGNPK